MPRTLPKIKSSTQQLIIDIVHDYFFVGDMVRANQMALWLMGRRKGVKLTDEEVVDLRRIKINLQDEIYLSSFSK